MTDVLIVNPPSPDGHVYIRDMCRWGRKSREKMVWPQTSLAYLAAMVPDGLSVRIIDAIAEEMSLEAFLEEIRKEKPRFFVSYITGTTFAVDARGGALMIAEFARRHLARGAGYGRIISLTSGTGGFPEEVSYGAAKAALNDYTLAAAFELADAGITANVVHPPVTDTGWVTSEVRAAVAASQDLIHVATPEQVADVIAYLAEERAGLITGNIIRLR